MLNKKLLALRISIFSRVQSITINKIIFCQLITLINQAYQVFPDLQLKTGLTTKIKFGLYRSVFQSINNLNLQLLRGRLICNG